MLSEVTREHLDQSHQETGGWRAFLAIIHNKMQLHLDQPDLQVTARAMLCTIGKIVM